LPGVYGCNDVFPAYTSGRVAFCVNGYPTTTQVLLDRRTGVAIVVCERLNALTPLFPGMAVGALLDSDTFSLDDGLTK
jgi:hypothetical protein